MWIALVLAFPALVAVGAGLIATDAEMSKRLFFLVGVDMIHHRFYRTQRSWLFSMERSSRTRCLGGRHRR